MSGMPRGVPSRLGLLVDLSPRNIERVLYFSSYVITSVDQKAVEEVVKELQEKNTQSIAQAETELEAKISDMKEATVEEVNRLRSEWETKKVEMADASNTEIEQIRELTPRQLLTEGQHQDLRQKYGQIFEAGMGAEAILKLITRVNLERDA